MMNKMAKKFTAAIAAALMIITADAGAALADNALTAETELSETDVMDIENYDKAQLIQIAIDNQVNSYAPYSNYNVSAAVLMSSGKVYKGVNVENASYPAGICAERNAIFHAIECGESQIVAIAIVGGSDYTVKDYCAPCGVCRQVMREFCDPEEMHVIFAKTTTDYKDMTLEELLPESFGPEALEN